MRRLSVRETVAYATSVLDRLADLTNAPTGRRIHEGMYRGATATAKNGCQASPQRLNTTTESPIPSEQTPQIHGKSNRGLLRRIICSHGAGNLLDTQRSFREILSLLDNPRLTRQQYHFLQKILRKAVIGYLFAVELGSRQSTRPRPGDGDRGN